MLRCWGANPEDRPTFSEIREMIESMMISDNPYLDLSSLDESKDCYNAPSFNSIDDDDGNESEMVSDQTTKETHKSGKDNDSGIHENNECNTELDDVFDPVEKTSGPVFDFDLMQARFCRKTSGAIA
mgnify:CR=1 FL=1